MPFLQRDELLIHYEIEGQGPWLTLLHGQSQSLDYWSAQVATLAPRFQMLRIDLRGHGRSSAPLTAAYGQAEHAADVLAVLDHLGIAATHLWGTHTGAAVGLLLAADQPGRIASLVLEGPVIPGVAMPSAERHIARAREIAGTRGVEAAIDDWLEHAAWFTEMRREPERRRWLDQQRIVRTFSGAPWLASGTPEPVQPLRERLPTLHQPTLIVNGERDLDDFLETAATLERLLPHARRYLIPGAGPFAAWEEPEAVTPAVAAFLD
jgi:3-oxoadipate enol-lactonase